MSERPKERAWKARRRVKLSPGFESQPLRHMSHKEEMLSIKTILKVIVLNMLPERVLQIAKKVHYARRLRSVSESDQVDFKVFKYLIKPGDCAVDIGSNFGVYTKYLSELVGSHGHVYSIEPIPFTFEILRSNFKKLGVKNVELFNYAISDNNASMIMEVPLHKSGIENFYGARIVHENTHSSLRRVRVNSKTVDSLFSELPYKISFIKCDVEGQELQCVKGAINIINNSKPAWHIEASGNPDDLTSTTYEAFELLKEKGYEAFWFDGTNLKKRRSGDRSVNYFFLLPEHLQALREGGFLHLDIR